MSIRRGAALVAGLLALGALAWGANPAARAHPAYCPPDALRAPAPSPFGTARRRLDCEVYRVRTPRGELLLATALDDAQRERGLMFVTALPPGTGMMFAFPDGDRQREFWMKNTLIPLDMVFVTGDGTIASVARAVPATSRATPDDAVPRRSGYGRFVIELNANEADREGLVLGARLDLIPLEAR